MAKRPFRRQTKEAVGIPPADNDGCPGGLSAESTSPPVSGGRSPEGLRRAPPHQEMDLHTTYRQRRYAEKEPRKRLFL